MKINAAQLKQLIKEQQSNVLSEAVDPNDALDELEGVASQLASLNQQAMRLLDGLQGEGVLDQQTHTRAYRGWFAMIEQALSPESQWMGGTTMDTLQDSIQAVRSSLKPLGVIDVEDAYEMLVSRGIISDDEDDPVDASEALWTYFEEEGVPENMIDAAIEKWMVQQ
jgi:hypothetical protein